MQATHDLATIIRTACLVKRTTQDAVARSLGIDPGRFSRIASGQIVPSATVAGQIARALGLAVEDLWPAGAPRPFPSRGRPRKAQSVTP